MNKPLAIIIPAYKATFLRETLESIANQSSKDFHLYIGDDCSPYDIKSIVDEFVDRIPLTYHRFESNMGGSDLVAQWERCIALSKYEPYIWLFSDDDTMDPECVLTIVNHIKSTNKSIFRLNVEVIDQCNNVIRHVKYPEYISALDLYIGKITYKLDCFVVEFIFSREKYETTGHFVKFDLAWGSDLATWINLSMGSDIQTINGGIVRWRCSGINISTTESEDILIRKSEALVDFLLWGESIFNGEAHINKINTHGLISRITSMAVSTNRRLGLRPIKRFTKSKNNYIILITRYYVLYLLKKMRNVF